MNCATGRRIILRAEHVFGRSHLADTVLDHPGASQLHASIRWTGRSWELRDHSRNGTQVNAHWLPLHGAVTLERGASLGFGLDDAAWTVESVAPPGSLLWPLDDQNAAVIRLQDSNLLPDTTRPEVRIDVGAGGHWQCCTGGDSRLLQDGDEIEFGGQRWCFVSGNPVHPTQDLAAAMRMFSSDARLHFQVSLDEEHVSLRLTGVHPPIDLGERTHHYCLLTLARLRLSDAQREIDPSAQGWVDMERLTRMLGTDPSHLNIQIFRARRQIAQALPAGCVLPDVVERRRGAVRFGELGARILRGSRLEGMLPSPVTGARAAGPASHGHAVPMAGVP